MSATAPLLGFEEIAEFMAELDPSRVINLQPSAPLQARVQELIEKKKDAGLTSEEQRELDRYLTLENLIALAKARARRRMAA